MASIWYWKDMSTLLHKPSHPPDSLIWVPLVWPVTSTTHLRATTGHTVELGRKASSVLRLALWFSLQNSAIMAREFPSPGQHRLPKHVWGIREREWYDLIKLYFSVTYFIWDLSGKWYILSIWCFYTTYATSSEQYNSIHHLLTVYYQWIWVHDCSTFNY